MIGAADLHQAMYTAWSNASLDAHFSSLWQNVTTSNYIVLHDTMATPGQPFPYCVFEISPSVTTDRMSCGNDSIREIRNFPIEFTIHTRTLSSDSRTPKKIAADLLEEVMKVFGGHPTQAPTGLTLDNGNHLITTYQNDFGVCTGEDEYAWSVSYLAKLDIPITVQ